MFRKTKIIGTIGPATESFEMIEKLADAGMNIARLNFSHEDQESQLKRIETIEKVNKKREIPISILVDTKGPEIRCGKMENDAVEYQLNDIVTVYKYEMVGNREGFHIASPELFDDVKRGNTLLIDDGKLRLTILEVKADELVCRVENPGFIKTRKGVNVPGVKLTMPFISDKDEADIRFACQHNIDFLAASFVRRAEDVLDIRKILIEEGKPKTQIIAKIESQEGYENIEEILKVSDGIMVARGDLGVEVSTQLVPIYQKIMISKANEFGKPVITATHMLESMINNPRPTRAEASDVANAILDGSDAIMLSGESAVGDYPTQAVTTMDIIARAIEDIIPYKDNVKKSRLTSEATIQDSIGYSITNTCLNLPNVAAIVAFTQGGSTARRISKFRPPVPILAITFTKETQRRLQSYWGVIPIFSKVQNELTNDDDLASTIAKAHGFLPGQLIILTAGYPTGEGTANMMKIIEIK